MIIHRAKKWPEKVVQRSFIKGHSFPIGLYVVHSLFHFGLGGFHKLCCLKIGIVTLKIWRIFALCTIKTLTAEILQIFRVNFWKIDDFINSLWLNLTFKQDYLVPDSFVYILLLCARFFLLLVLSIMESTVCVFHIKSIRFNCQLAVSLSLVFFFRLLAY